MFYPPIPATEEERLASLRRYALLDTPPEAAFDRLAALAARVFQVPLALVTLVDRDRQWFKSCQGPASSRVRGSQTPRQEAFCAHTILSPQPFVVEDLQRDQRFADNPLVTGELGVRFYAGAPLIAANGHALGSLCLLDFSARTLSAEQQSLLMDLAASVVSEMELRRASAELADSERLYRQMFEDNPQPMWIFEKETLRFLAVNDAAIGHYGYTRGEFLAMTLCDIRPLEDVSRLHQEYPGQADAQGLRELWRHRKKDGTEIQVEVSRHFVGYEGRTACLVIASDVTEREREADARRRSEQTLSLHVQQTPLAFMEWNLDREITAWNPAAERMFGYARGEVLGRAMLPMLVPEDARSQVEEITQALLTRSGGGRSTNENLTKDGRRILCQWYNTPLVDGRGRVIGVAALAQDVTEHRALEAEREALLVQTEHLLVEALESADRDPLTGLLNHRAFHHRLKEEAEGTARRAGGALAVLMTDLDNFKFFNDAYGHLAGDDVLRQVARVLNACAGPGDILARFGGDEFALLLPGAGPEEAARMAARLREAVSAVGYRPPGYDTPIPLTLSVGEACAPEDGPGQHAVLEAADARLRLAKSGGGGGKKALGLRRRMAGSVEGFSMLDALVTAVDNKDRYTRRHSEDVMTHSLQIARALGLDADARHAVEVAALLHDVGKIGVPDHILRKPGRLTEEEFQAVRQHPLMGAVIVGAVPGFEEALDAIRHHHERWDGAGYPFGLRGEETPLTARLMAVADAYSAMTTDRPYRQGMEFARARRLLEEGAGTQWDPVCVAAFFRAAA